MDFCGEWMDADICRHMFSVLRVGWQPAFSSPFSWPTFETPFADCHYLHIGKPPERCRNGIYYLKTVGMHVSMFWWHLVAIPYTIYMYTNMHNIIRFSGPFCHVAFGLQSIPWSDWKAPKHHMDPLEIRCFPTFSWPNRWLEHLERDFCIFLSARTGFVNRNGFLAKSGWG